MARARAKNFIETVKDFTKDTSRKEIEEKLRLSFETHHQPAFLRKKPKITMSDLETGTTALIEAVKLGNFDAVDVISQYVPDAEYVTYVDHRDKARKNAQDYSLLQNDRRIVSRLALKDADLSRVTPLPTLSTTVVEQTLTTTSKNPRESSSTIEPTKEYKEPSSSESLQRMLEQCVACTEKDAFLELLELIITYETKKLEKNHNRIALVPNICNGILLAAAKENKFRVIEFLVSNEAAAKLGIRSASPIWNTLLFSGVKEGAQFSANDKNSSDELNTAQKHAFIEFFLPLAISLNNGVFAHCSPNVEMQIKLIIAPNLAQSKLDKKLIEAKQIGAHTRHLSDSAAAAKHKQFKPRVHQSNKSVDEIASSSNRSQSPSDDSRPASPRPASPLS